MESIVTINVNKPYPVYISESYGNLPAAFETAGLAYDRICVVADENTARYADKVCGALLSVSYEPSLYKIKPGDENKNLQALGGLLDFFAREKLDRRSTVAALGGGVTGDIAGFAAAVYMRGINFVQLPTSLLSQTDSCVGGKTAINHGGVKNLAGAFYQPKFAYINTSTLRTLPRGEFINGLAEVVKHGLIADAEYLKFISQNKNALLDTDKDTDTYTDVIGRVIEGSCRIKEKYVAADEFEMLNGSREALNFGHTFAHAIESLTDYGMPHGACVSVGMCAALYISAELQRIGKDEALAAERLLSSFGLPVRVSISGIDPSRLLDVMYNDKKTHRNALRLVLLRRIGEAYTDNAVSVELVDEAIEYILGTSDNSG